MVWTAQWNHDARVPSLAPGGCLDIAHNAAARWAYTDDQMDSAEGPVDILLKLWMGGLRGVVLRK